MNCVSYRGKDEDQVPEGLPPKVVEVYRSVGKIMSRYSTGKVPKAFKIIPNLKNWEEVSSVPAWTAYPSTSFVHGLAALSAAVCTSFPLACQGVGTFCIDCVLSACGMQRLLWLAHECLACEKKTLCRCCG